MPANKPASVVESDIQVTDISLNLSLIFLVIAETFGIDYTHKTLYAFYGLIQRHQAREKWNQDIQMLCAGADSKKLKTKYWGESLKEK